MTVTPLASLGPLLVAVTVKVTFWPTDGVGLSTVFWSATSAEAAAFSVATAESLLVLGSGSLADVLVAVLVIVPGWVSTAVMVSVALAPFWRSPTCHCPEDGTYEPCCGEAETKVMPAGSTSVMTTPLAWFGPLLSTLTKSVTVSPTSAEVGVTLFRTATSAFRLTGVCVLVLRLPGFGSVVGVEHGGRVHDRIGRGVAERDLEGRGDGAGLSG